jgi:predicted ribosome quality control (RQC) complex YloA/Tae2 family protein
MQFEGVTLAAVVHELRQKLPHSFIQQVYHPLRELLLLQLYGREKHSLLIAASRDSRIQLTQQQYENPPAPFAFCMLLRKYLKGGEIQEIRQPGLERMVDLHILRHAEEYVLRAELMGARSNVVLLHGNEILGVLRPTRGPRKLVPHALYEPPAAQGKLDPRRPAEKEKLRHALTVSPDETVKKALLRAVEGIGPRTAVELLTRAGLKAAGAISSLNPQQWDRLWETVDEFFARLARAELEPCLYLEAGEPVDCTPVPYESYAHLAAQRYGSMSEALDACYRERHQEPFEQLARTLLQRIQQRTQKTEGALVQIERDLKNAEKYDEYKEQADLLMAHLSQMQRGQREIQVQDFTTGAKRTIPLDARLDPAANAQRYYGRYKKLKRAVERLKERQRELEMERSYWQELHVQVEQAESLEELRELEGELELEEVLSSRKKHVGIASGPRCYTMDGFSILVGRNGRQNDALIRQAQRDEYWLHAKDRPGAHVIIRSDRRGATPSERVLLRAAELAAYYSRGRSSAHVPVTYTRVKYLKKPKGARPGLVTVTREEGTLTVAPKEGG